MDVIGERLRDYLAGLTDRVVAWGEHDCATFAANWVARETGKQPRLPRYASRAEAHDAIARAHGLVPLYAAELSRLGFAATDAPRVGDVGVVRLSFGDVGAIFADGGVAYLVAERGLIGLRVNSAHILGAWSIHG